MAGAKTGVTFDDRQAQAALQRLEDFAGHHDAALRDIGEFLHLSHDERFEAEQSPDGVDWVDLSPAYAKRKEAKRPSARKLVFDDLMHGLLRYQIVGTTLEFGTDRVQAATHQFGDPARGIPQREFLGLSEADAAEAVEILQEHLGRALSGR